RLVEDAEHGAAGIGAAGSPFEAGHVAALLVDPEQDLLALGAQRPAERGQLPDRRHVVGEEHDSAASLGQEAARPVRRDRPREAREDAGRRERLETHPFTAPAVSPKAIRRCTSRKKTTTGIAVSVDAAISAPQSVCRLEPRKYESQTVTVCLDWSLSSTRAKMYSFHVVMNANTDVATRPGPISGRRIF